MQKTRKFIKKIKQFIVPDSLLSRLMVIMIFPIILSQLIVTYIFYERHWNNVSDVMINYVVGEIAYILSDFDNLDAHDMELIRRNLRLDVALMKNMSLPSPKVGDNNSISYFKEALSEKIKRRFSLRQNDVSNDMFIFIEMSPKEVLRIHVPKKRFETPTTYIFILWMFGTVFVLTSVAVIFCRNQVRSIEKLAEAAEKFGRGIEGERPKIEGAKEVRKASIAFSQMQERIKRQMYQRIEMLAGISHDLRTPITRLKLQLAFFNKTKEVEGMNNDINEMEQMVNGYLAFAKGEEQEKAQEFMLESFLGNIIAQYNNLKIELKAEEDLRYTFRPVSFKRAITNIFDNATKYASEVLVTISSCDEGIKIKIEDNGPGVPEDQYDYIFRPFTKLDEARNLNKGGSVGLGLSIARDIIYKHAGNIYAKKSKALGGLATIIILP